MKKVFKAVFYWIVGAAISLALAVVYLAVSWLLEKFFNWIAGLNFYLILITGVSILWACTFYSVGKSFVNWVKAFWKRHDTDS